MKKPLLVIITGAPATGKTSLAKYLSEALRLPYISKDELKEVLFDQLGWSDKAWSRTLSVAGYRLMDKLLANQLETGNSVIIESNFQAPYDSKRITGFIRQHQAECVQIICHTQEEIRSSRFSTRDASGQRHLGHQVLDEDQADLGEEPYLPLDVPGTLIELDTTDFTQLPYEEIVKSLKSHL